ncbi:MAG: ARMT1-like domain-containing protein [Candidatus Cloacimonadota bacterium]|nr:ARMT1-like domain-containing protein [Candidatus Cloacimonadota bacterium]
MKTYLDCLPCFMNQALRAGRIATNDEQKIKKLLDEVGMLIQKIPFENTPPETGALIYKKVSEITGNNDPYKKIKGKNIEHALHLYPELKQKVKKSDDGLLTAIRLAVAGNVIDLGVDKEFNIVKDVETILHQEFAVFDYELFKQELSRAKEILYLGDNSGEAVFDKILIEELGKPITFVVREIPIINDITKKEAKQIGIDKIAKVISSGTTAPGTILDYCNDEFIEIFNNADMVISKGQGNYEGLSGVNRSIFFLLKAKCPVIARNIGVKENDIILKEMNVTQSS